MIQGGQEETCLPPHYPEMNEEETGHPCPRREWESPGDPQLYELMLLGASSERGHLFREMFSAYFGDEPPQERQRALRRILRAYGDEQIAGVLWPKRD